MAPGADKRILFEPAGAIGLVDRTAKLLIQFDEVDQATRPKDQTGACEDFDIAIAPVSVVMPSIAPAVLGRGRVFNGGTTGLGARDLEPGATLITRDASIQVVLSWDAVAQDAAGTPGTIISRGLGSSAAEYVGYGLRIDVSDVPTRTGLLRWYWQDVAGVEQLQDGAEIVMPSGQYTMLTATRRWISPTEVELRYYVGDTLAGIVTSADGSIGGGTTGALQLGYRTVAGVNGAFLAGTLDELLVVDRELCIEEIEATWLRITKYQPLGVQLFTENFDPDFPKSDLPSSDTQLNIRMTGQALGYAAAQAENLRSNFVPQRAYGSTLEQWEQAVAVTPKPVPTAGSIDERRGRVLSRLRQKQGISIPGMKEALRDLVDCDVDDLGFVAYSQTVTDEFAVIDPVRWSMTPAGCATSVAGQARFAPGAGSYVLDDHTTGWLTMARGAAQPWRLDVEGLEQVIAKLVMSTPQSGLEAGVWFGDKAAHNYVLLGLKDVAGSFRVVTERFTNHVSQGAITQQVLGANPAAIWLWLGKGATDSWVAHWSVTGPTTGYTASAPIAHHANTYWAGMYFRSTAAIGAGVADFDDFVLYTPNASRPFNAYVFRDPGLGGQPDIQGARSVIRSIKHGFTHATLTESLEFLVGDDGSVLGLDPL